MCGWGGILQTAYWGSESQFQRTGQAVRDPDVSSWNPQAITKGKWQHGKLHFLHWTNIPRPRATPLKDILGPY